MQRIDNAEITVPLKGIIKSTQDYMQHLEIESLKKLAELGVQKAKIGASTSPAQLKVFLIPEKDGVGEYEVSFQELSRDYPDEALFAKLALVMEICGYILRKEEIIKTNNLAVSDLINLQDKIGELQAYISDVTIRSEIAFSRNKDMRPVDTEGGKFLNLLDNHVAAATYGFARNERQLIDAYKTNIVNGTNNFKFHLDCKDSEPYIEDKKNALQKISKNIIAVIDDNYNIDFISKVAKQEFDTHSVVLKTHGSWVTTLFKPTTESSNFVNFLYNQNIHLLDRAKALQINLDRPRPRN